MAVQLNEDIFKFLNALKENNQREWMAENKPWYLKNEALLKSFYGEIQDGLNTFDHIEKTKVFRIHRDVRFSKNKTPYNVHRSASFSREGAHRRGGYYLRIEPGGKSRMAGGFFNPNPADLKRIRKEFEVDAAPIRTILNATKFKKAFSGLNTNNQVKTAPRGFDIENPANDLIKNKSFVVSHSFSDQEVLSANFKEQLLDHYRLLQPFFEYMSEVLTTDLNGASLLNQ
ncbi:DUF2461 domain-containing protein [Flavimarina sp. Hel_I_48]|uniref:DUF2461 domain-containing protein n=1 Tax=Flavimarina sp. Hel_I_48 TaxID=1392488 RepID=UPI0004DF3CF9|nr:DUF2461 domain-containing protein [Flavimarina sp. Hel_I_48]